jgi:hypothetical protein
MPKKRSPATARYTPKCRKSFEKARAPEERQTAEENKKETAIHEEH